MEEQDSLPRVSMLLPSRGRTVMLKDSVKSLIDHADQPDRIEWLMGFDNDDQSSIDYFIDDIVPLIESSGGTYVCARFEPMGYANLNRYLNSLAKHARAAWFVFWNDDAVMMTDHWDSEIASRGTRFCIQAFDTHKKHPYSIFPIVPRAWFEELGHLSQHSLTDAYISQIAWLLDIMEQIPIAVEHRRFDLTGENDDATYRSRKMYELEGNINNPRDFNHAEQRQLRIKDAYKLADYLQARGYDLTHWQDVLAGRRDPWEKMLAADVNRQVARINVTKK